MIDTKTLAEKLGAELYGTESAEVNDVTHDSRQARRGSLFVAIQGETVDGHRFVDDVVRRGAAGVISELDKPEGFEGSWLKVPDARTALAQAAKAVHGDPSSEIELVGITGTNGKTTTTYLAFALLEAAGKKAAMLTTVEYRIGAESEPAVRTTPEASDTQRFLRDALDRGCEAGVMEASSQAIDLHRCDGLDFRAAVFTNLTRDHLDYHLTMENYFDAKKKLFDGRLGKPPECSIVNVDDEWGRGLVSELSAKGQKVVTFSQKTEADLTAEKIEVSLLEGTRFELRTPAGNVPITSPLIGRPHVYNMLSAAAVALELGHDLDSVVSGLSRCVGAPGRFESVPSDAGFAVIVDYAHTDDALLNTLRTAKELAKGRIITVMGCGGDRDKSKRAPMGKIAGDLSDLVIVTSDNPRTEDPVKIIREIEKGVQEAGGNYIACTDRLEAIHLAVSKAKPEDVVIIAGKGHETYQIIGNDKFHFDDREIAAEALEALED
ncbi:MAG: UDP-N-acetylmuramoyl-L-alanyl-D-glutamate--2,6-diaminopimelate ligase [Acidobacteria bacterium]|nr:MAG: UDP-N-acetylmuramoyl-L-alanyl-D-glutamate--2,6-diaminopimelate ligase [Acidobacteriota bacterium]REK03080.1 MAG: UDP-N-acetylmuramoyl-L-alanyl-D-glutamate--2,6-diaminopimelate ligase [Acidobacteriota bacterium]REK15428.1 MAG: UDP-N-acetylmuramoyl-L-alanyl-D-glutamate--2,6-diaminopimelate ligase [Acidobacteriota bacterium]REK45779.1 MAG: UDP-N-acetylmuramoyl-L-alanyl-D-glutamate--2,6-diaminopimelate ligase [Acidobacteriota bacterium]